MLQEDAVIQPQAMVTCQATAHCSEVPSSTPFMILPLRGRNVNGSYTSGLPARVNELFSVGISISNPSREPLLVRAKDCLGTFDVVPECLETSVRSLDVTGSVPLAYGPTLLQVQKEVINGGRDRALTEEEIRSVDW